MHNSKHRLPCAAVAFALLGCVFAAQAQTIGPRGTLQLLRAPQDLIAAQLRTPASGRIASAGLDHAPVAVSWALEPSASLDARPQPFVRESREYWIDASESELHRGIGLALSAPGAVIRISPHGGRNDASIAAGDIALSSAGRRLDNGVAIRSVVGEDELRAAGMDAPAGSIALRLADSVAAGKLQLALPTARGDYLVHVYEPASVVVLELGAERDSIAGGDSLRFRAAVSGVSSLDRIGGLVSAPDGSNQNLDFVRQVDGSYVASVTPDPAHAGDRGLWEVHAFAVVGGKLAIARDAKSAFAVSVPVARFDGAVTRNSAAQAPGLVLRLGFESVLASRYQVSAVLYGTGADGALHPAAIAQSAAWLERGNGSIDLRYDASSLTASLGAPWELRDLRLVNQADMSLLERRERAIALP
jgi:hypothetical protein